MECSVLIVDDEADFLDSIADVLSSETSQVFKACNAKDALEIMESQEIHLVISDIIMPGMSGIDLLRAIRQKEFECPVIFVSACESSKFLQTTLKNDIFDFVEKPFEAKDLLCLVKRCLARFQSTGS